MWKRDSPFPFRQFWRWKSWKKKCVLELFVQWSLLLLLPLLLRSASPTRRPLLLLRLQSPPSTESSRLNPRLRELWCQDEGRPVQGSGFRGHDMGWFIKCCSIKVKKKCYEKWRWSSRKLKTWYMWNNTMVNTFPKKDFLYFDLSSRYGHLNV